MATYETNRRKKQARFSVTINFEMGFYRRRSKIRFLTTLKYQANWKIHYGILCSITCSITLPSGFTKCAFVSQLLAFFKHLKQTFFRMNQYSARKSSTRSCLSVCTSRYIRMASQEIKLICYKWAIMTKYNVNTNILALSIRDWQNVFSKLFQKLKGAYLYLPRNRRLFLYLFLICHGTSIPNTQITWIFTTNLWYCCFMCDTLNS